MKQKFLDSLVGLPVVEAQGQVLKSGYEYISVDKGSILPAVAQSKTVILFIDGYNVCDVNAGDPLEIEK